LYQYNKLKKREEKVLPVFTLLLLFALKGFEILNKNEAFGE